MMSSSISAIGAAHVAVGTIALTGGGVVLGMAKGTPKHRFVGSVYAVAILLINGTALSIYDMTGRPNVFHVIAVVNLTTLATGMLALRRWRRTHDPRDLVTHQRRMAMNYVGLWMAFVTELLVKPMMGLSGWGDPRSHWPLMIALNIALFLIGRRLVSTRLITSGALA
jgi:uncharacterized membrane protein